MFPFCGGPFRLPPEAGMTAGGLPALFLPAAPGTGRKTRNRRGGVVCSAGARRRPNSGAQCCFEVNPCPQPHTVGGNHRKNRRSQRAAAVHFKSSRSGRGRNGAHFTMYLTYLHLELHSDRLAGNCTRFHGVRPHGTNERIYFFFSLSEKTPCVKTKHKNFFTAFLLQPAGRFDIIRKIAVSGPWAGF